MLSFRPLSGGDFAWAAAKRTGLFAAASLLFTPAILSLSLVLDCSNMSGACFATSLILLFWVKPAIYLAFILSFLNITVARARHAGLPLAAAAVVLLLLLADLRFGIMLGFVTGANLALMGFWSSPEPRYFLSALAAIATLCVLRGSDTAPEAWDARLGGLGTYAKAVAAILLAAAVWGSLESASIYLSSVRALTWLIPMWHGMGRVLGIAASLAPVMLLPIGMSEWRAAGEPGRASPWVRAVAAAVILLCASSTLGAVAALLLWVSPAASLGVLEVVSIPIKALNLAALLGALALPALIAKMLEGASPVLPPGSRRRDEGTETKATFGSAARTPSIFGRRGRQP